MTSLRVLSLAAGALGLAVAATSGLLPTQRAAPAAARPASSAAFTSPSTSTTTSTSTSTTTTTSDVTARGGSPARPAPDLRDVPASVLSRAAAARALDRKAGAACRPLVRSDTSCAPQRDTLEIQWDVGKDP